ncbi:MAG TPA: TetR/AcrR family transcriptional regulator C-terminal domain-containing protein [Streptosporangiaceae bacterium]|nr:TetR/AcrR family transcriptional regulator C-terminal domain-containing protein [Streptosporangiaceae bacterium]
MLAEMEFLLSAVDGLGLAMDEMVQVVRTVDSFVVGYTQSELSERQWRHFGQLNAAGKAGGARPPPTSSTSSDRASIVTSPV